MSKNRASAEQSVLGQVFGSRCKDVLTIYLAIVCVAVLMARSLDLVVHNVISDRYLHLRRSLRVIDCVGNKTAFIPPPTLVALPLSTISGVR